MLSVLIAEDNLMLADILEDYLTFGGYHVCAIGQTVEEAVALADRHNPDLAVIDFRLGNSTLGPQIRPLLKDKTRMGILYATADPLDGSLTRLDGEAFIRKPFLMEEILQALHIVHEMKKGGDTSALPIPNNFYPLRDPVEVRQAVA